MRRVAVRETGGASAQITQASGTVVEQPSGSSSTGSVATSVNIPAFGTANRTTYREYGLVFAKELEDVRTHPARLGDPLALSAIAIQFGKLTASAQLRRIRFHGLRHTSATLLLNAGVAVHQVSARLGHATASMTLDVYAHALDDAHATVAAKIGSVLYS